MHSVWLSTRTGKGKLRAGGVDNLCLGPFGTLALTLRHAATAINCSVTVPAAGSAHHLATAIALTTAFRAGVKGRFKEVFGLPLQGGVKMQRGNVDTKPQFAGCHTVSPGLPVNRWRGREGGQPCDTWG